MDKTTNDWEMQPQEQEGDYWFSGTFVVTQGVKALLTEEEIYWIYIEIQTRVQQNQGLDYLAVFKKEGTEDKLYFVDQLSKADIASGAYSSEHNYCTLMLTEEY